MWKTLGEDVSWMARERKYDEKYKIEISDLLYLSPGLSGGKVHSRFNYEAGMRFWYVVILFVALCSQDVCSQQVMKSVVGGGGTIARTGGMVASGTIGQPVIGRSNDLRSTVLSGFWYSVVKDPRTTSATGGSTSTPTGSLISGPITVTPHPVTNISSFKFVPECTGVVSIALVDLAGETVATIYNEYTASDVNITFDSNGLVSGTYILRVKTPCSERSQRIVILH
jgi:hypothetical protein